MIVIPKTLGADIELGNSLTRGNRSDCGAAVEAVLRAVRHVPHFPCVAPDGLSGTQSERGRHWFVNGCLYEDMRHLEMALGECASARTHAAAFHGMLRMVRRFRREALKRLDPDDDLFVNAHVSDGTLQTSWGAHLNVQVSRVLFDSLFAKPHLLALYASYVAAAAPVFGQGLLLPTGGGRFRYVTSARAHQIGEIVGLPTTVQYRRNLVNSRDEPHAGEDRARLHIIAFDTNLQPASIMLRGGLTQLLLAALECQWFDAELILDDPVAAVKTWSRSFHPQTGNLKHTAVARPNGSITLTQWHRRLLNQLRSLVEEGLIGEEIVPDGREILELWDQTLDDLETGHDRLKARFDWALKWELLRAQLEQGSDVSDPALRLLDQLYSHVDDHTGLFWRFWRAGLVDRCGVDDAAIGRSMTAGDPRTRSGLRGELVRRLHRWITAIDWSYIEVASGSPHRWWESRKRRIELPDPSLPSGDLVTELRERFPRDEQLLEWLLNSDTSHNETNSTHHATPT